MQYSQNFYTNVALFVLALVVLGLSIWAFVAPCKKDGFGDQECGCSEIENPGPYDCGYHGSMTETECDNKPGFRQSCIYYSSGEEKDNCCGNWNMYGPDNPLSCIPDSHFCPVCK
jgi:hypothetical protein